MTVRLATPAVPECARRGCTRPARRRGYCDSDYSWARRTGRAAAEPKVPIDQMQKRVKLLHRKYGMTYEEIASRVGAATSTISDAAAGARPMIRQRIADAVMEIPLEYSTTSPQRCDSTGTRRRIAAMRRDGWSLPEICKHLNGITYAGLRSQLERDRVSFRTRAEIIRVFDRLAGTRGPNAQVAGRYAHEVPAQAWPDERIDYAKCGPRGLPVTAQ